MKVAVYSISDVNLSFRKMVLNAGIFIIFNQCNNET